jgi:predicted transposase/invertase (TIGR01784 family)
METLKRMPFKARKAVFEKLEEIADVASLSKEERERYENSVNVYRTNLCVMDAAKEEGRQEGLEEGLEEGRQEVRLANARSMKAGGFTNAVISKITGLSEDEIAAL